MALYPSLEDMKVDQIQKAQMDAATSFGHQTSTNNNNQQQLPYPTSGVTAPQMGGDLASVYPSLMDEYMGLRLEPPSGPVQPRQATGSVAVPGEGGARYSGMVAPLSGQSAGLARAEVTHGIREVILCKDGEGKIGLRSRDIDNGVFVQFVKAGSPSALAGLRFGDQLLQMDGKNLAGLSGDKVMTLLKKANPQRIVIAVRDRPYERTITLHKDSSAHVGFTHNDGKITNVAKDSSAARNGLLINHQIMEVNGQNVVGMNSKNLCKITDGAGQILTLTIMPFYIYEHMMKKMEGGLVKKLMDHSIPDIY